jgi:hypothetical protein
MCPLLALIFEGLFLWWPLTVLMMQTRQAVRAFKKSIYLDVYDYSTHIERVNKVCQSIACTRLFNTGLMTAGGKKLECFG